MSIFINLAVIFWSLFPSLISYVNNDVQPLKIQLTQLVANSDLLIPKASPNENQPLGFTYGNATDISLTNGIAKFTATAQNGSISLADYSIFTANGYYYTYARVKCDSSNSAFIWQRGTRIFHSGSNSFELLSAVALQDNKSYVVRLSDYRSSGWTPIEVDYIGAINITDLVSRGMLPSGLTDNEYKILIDDILLELGSTFQDDYFYSESLIDNYSWFRTGFVSPNEPHQFYDYLGFFFWLSFPYLFAFGLYKLLKGVFRG